MTFALVFIILMLILFAFVGWIVYWAISRSVKKNRQYQTFALQYGYRFDKAQGNSYYRDYSKHQTSGDRTVSFLQNPYVKKYADFHQFPFNRGSEIKVAYVISGTYHGSDFRAFTYHFEGNAPDRTGSGGVFSIVMIACSEKPGQALPDQVFYEKGMLCEYLRENLNVATIHDRIDRLINIEKGA